MNRFWLLIVLAGLFSSVACAQLNYGVSSGTATFTPLNPATANVVTALGTVANPPVRPSGFAFPLEGNMLHEFRIRDVGVIQFGDSPSIGTTYWTHSPMCARMVAPFLHDLSYTASSVVSWEFQGSVLTVEWLNVEDGAPPAGNTPRTISFQALLDTASGEIEYRYGASTGGLYAIAGNDFAVSVTGATTPDGRCFIPGTLNGFVDGNGKLTQWPTDNYIRFTPTGLSRSCPKVTVVADGQTLSDNSQMGFPAGTTIASINLTLTVTDEDGDNVSLAAELDSFVLDDSEFENTSAPVSYVLQPTTGTMQTFSSHLVQLIVRDDQDGLRAIRVGLYVPDSSGGGGVFIDPFDLALVDFALKIAKASISPPKACSVQPGAGGFAAVLGLLLLLVVTLRFTGRDRKPRWPGGAASPG